MEIRKCRCCAEDKPVGKFANAGIIKGVQYRRHICIPCYSKKKNEKKAINRQKLFAYKEHLKCESCGIDDHRVIEFHHRDRTQKDYAVSDMMGWSWKRIQKELDKCDALCANCHRILHYEEREAKRAGISAV